MCASGPRSARALAAWIALLLVAGFWGLRIAGAGSEPGFDDLGQYYYPSYRATAEALRSGHLPVWNPHQLAGVPWFPEVQLGSLYPPHWVMPWLATGPAMALLSLAHFLGAAGAMVAFARHLGLPAASAVAGAGLLVMRGTYSWSSAAPNLLETAVWLPVGALGVVMLVRGRRRGAALLAAAVAASLLAGYPQHSVYSGYAWALLGGLLLALERPPVARARHVVVSAAAALALGVGLAAVQWLPLLELSGDATRSLADLPSHQMFPFGRPHSLADGLARAFDAERHDLAASFGWVGLGLAALALARGPHRRLAVALAVVGALALAVAMGPVTPLFELYRALPLTGPFRLPERIGVVSDFAFALLGAIGLQRVAALAGRAGMRGSLAAGAVAALALAELVLAEPRRPALPYFDGSLARRYEEALPADVLERLRASSRVLVLASALESPLPPKLASVLGFRSVADYAPMPLRRQAELLGHLARGRAVGTPTPSMGRVPFPRSEAEGRRLGARRRLLDLAAVERVVLPAGLAFGDRARAFIEAASLEPELRSERVVVLRNPAALPRAYVTHRALPAPPPAALLTRLARPDFDPLEASYVEGEVPLPGPRTRVPYGRPLRIVVDEPARVELIATVSVPGLVVLADSYHRGWRAFVDGVPARVLPTNHAFRGVVVEPGRHRVRFEYHAPGLARGALASALALGVAGLAGWRYLGRGRGIP